MPTKTKGTAKPRGKGVPFTGKDDPRSNKNGAPFTEHRISFHLQKELEKTPEGYEAKISNASLIAQNMVKKARDNDDAALAYIKEIADRTEGKAKQAVEHTGEDGGPLVVKIITYNEELSTGSPQDDAD